MKMPQETEPELSAVAFHEAGHAITLSASFRDAVWLPREPPALPVRYVEVTETAPGQWTGSCVGMNVYSVRWADRLAPRYLDLMLSQASIHLAWRETP